MVGSIIKLIIGLFFWMVLPSLISKKLSNQKNIPPSFLNVSCKLIGIVIIAFAIIDFIRSIFS